MSILGNLFAKAASKARGVEQRIFSRTKTRRQPINKGDHYVEIDREDIDYYGGGGSDTLDVASMCAANPWARAATYAVARTVASLKPQVYIIGKDGKETIQNSGEAVDFFNNPSPDFSRYDLMEMLVIDIYQRGNAYWELIDRGTIERDGKQEEGKIPLYVVPLSARKVRPRRDKRRLIRDYRYSYAKLPLDPKKVTHFRLITPDDMVEGVSIYEAAIGELELYANALGWNRSFFKNYTVPPAYLKLNGAVSVPERKRIKADWKSLHGGPDKAHEIAVVGEGAELKELGTSPKDVEFGGTMERCIEVILAAAGVPPVVVGRLQGATYANAYQQLQSYWDETIIPITQKICDEWNRKIMPRFSKEGMKLLVRLPIDDKLKRIKEEATRMSSIRQWHGANLLTREEARVEAGFSADPEIGEYQETPPALGGFGGGFAAALQPKRYDFKAWTPEMRKSFQKDFSTRIDRDMDKVAKAVLKMFEAQYKAVVASLVAPSEQAKAEFAEIAKKKLDWRKLEDALEEAALDEEGNIKQTLARVLIDSSRETAQSFGLEVKFDVRNPKVAAFLRKQAGDMIDNLGKTSLGQLRETLEEGYDAGESILKLKRRVAEVFGERDVYSPRMTTIAHTEVARAANFGALETYLESGVVQKKEWLSTNDEHTREWHKEANGQVVDVAEPFIVGGERLVYPGDSAGSAGNTIGCRCVSLPVIEGFEGV